jgi:hypothetical protein
MPQVIVPVGLAMGPRYRYAQPPDPQPVCYDIHLGVEAEELTVDEAAVWAAAFVDPKRHSRLEVSRDALIAYLTSAPKPLTTAVEVVGNLLERGLLMEFDPEEQGQVEEVFRRHHLLPLAEGLGSTPEEPHLYRIGYGGKALVALPSRVYTQWSYAFLHPNLWEACAYFADDSEYVTAGGDPLGLTTAGIAHDVAVNLPMMIATSCAFLDPVARIP